jgi:hypothetical protein
MKPTLPIVAVVMLAASPAAAQLRNTTYAAIVAETGCESKFRDAKKADIFAANYKGREITLAGEIATLKDDGLTLKILRNTLTFDVSIKLTDPKATYDLEKGQRVAVTFTMREAGGCFLPYYGDQGRISR